MEIKSKELRQKAIVKIEARIRASELMRKHKFVSASLSAQVDEYTIMQNVLAYIKKGRAFTLIRGNSFVSTPVGVVACKI